MLHRAIIHLSNGERLAIPLTDVELAEFHRRLRYEPFLELEYEGGKLTLFCDHIVYYKVFDLVR